MTQPRRIYPGQTVLITRRTLRRTHLLRPDRELSELYLYCLAIIAQKFGVVVHTVTIMSTHEHLVVTDTRGELPNFLRELHRLLALSIKSLREWDGALWDHEKTSVVELRTPEAVVEKLAYCIANPVAAGLVHHAEQWPGVQTAPEHLGRMSWTVKRPKHYFDPNNPKWPATATLKLAMPTVADRTGTEVRQAVADEVQRLELAAKQQVAADGRKVLGSKGVTALSPHKRTTSWEPLRGRNPAFAVGRGQSEARRLAVTALRAFRAAYRAALLQWRAGVRDVLFPRGTWTMRCDHGAQVAPS